MKKYLTNSEKKRFEYLISVVSSAINGTDVPMPYEDINWDAMLKTANICGLDSIFAVSLLKLKDKNCYSSEFAAKLNEIQGEQLLIDGVLDYEIEKILSCFDKHKIKNAPLKGYFMKKEYPRSDFRSVSDYDILFDVEQADELKKAFAELEYEFDHSDDNQYHFVKPPYMYIEMHATLVHEREHYYKYLVNQLDRTTKRDGYDYSYEMSIEDYYLYMLVHHSNHFRIGGMGIRMLLDIYVYYKNHKDEFDFEYLNKMLKEYQLDVFEKKTRQIAENWFSSAKPKITFDDFETYILLSCILGRLDTAVMISSQKSIAQSDGKKKSKLSYFLSSVFPPRKSYEFSYPNAYKYPVLLPAAWVSLWFKRFFISKNVHIKRGIKNRMSYNDEDINYITTVFNEAGFEPFKDNL